MNFYNHCVINLLRLIPPRIRGKRRIAKFLLANLPSNESSIVKDKFGFFYHVPLLSASIAYSLLVDGIYEPVSLNIIRKHLKPGDVFIDIGANIGVFTFPCALKVGVNGKVIAIEASPTILQYFKKNLEINPSNNITLEGCAVSDRDDNEIPFYEAPSESFGSGSFGPQYHDNPVLLKCRTLDSLLKSNSVSRVNVIKIDVEGYEAMVFKGARELLTSPDAPLIVFEFEDWTEMRLNLEVGAAQRQLRDFGYEIWSEKDYIQKRPPLNRLITQGSQNLVAMKRRKIQ